MEGRGQREIHAITSAGILIVALCAGLPVRGDDPSRTSTTFTSDQIRLYESEVKPILTQHCLKCHGGGPKIRGGFRLDSREAILRGGDLGPAATTGDPAHSLLVKAINYDELEMPPAGKLPAREIEILTRWVKEGLPWSPGSRVAADNPAEASKARPPDVTPAKPKPRDDWSLRTLVRPVVPPVKDNAWCRTPIDAFIRARLEAEGLTLAPPADRTTFIRRLTYDLTGLPPTPEEVDAFVADPAPDAHERLVDRLAGEPALRREMGPALARPGALWRDERLRTRFGQAIRLAVSRLRHRLAQPRQALRPVRPRATRRRRDRSRRGRISDCNRFLPPRHLGRRTRRSRARPLRRPGRHPFDHGPGRARHVDQLRALPRPQGRPDSPARLLSAARRLSRRHAFRTARI